MIKRIITLLCVTILIIFSTGVVFAEDVETGYIDFFGSYVLDGDIHWKTNAGTNDSGGQHARVIQGQGSLTSDFMVNMEPGKIETEEETFWQTYDNALRNLKVITATMGNLDNIRRTDSEQVYASWLEPDRGEVGSLFQVIRATHGNDFVDSFYVGFESVVSEGLTRRYADFSSVESKSHIKDEINVKGFAEIKETLNLEILGALETAIKWYDIF